VKRHRNGRQQKEQGEQEFKQRSGH
jgi:hypothetical protein